MRPIENDHLGGVAAAIVAAGAGAAACGVFYVVGAVKALGPYFNLYKPSGALSGVSTAAISLWLITWAVLARRWRHRPVHVGRCSVCALGLLVLGLLLTYPPIARLF
jgi:hypothetical protein